MFVFIICNRVLGLSLSLRFIHWNSGTVAYTGTCLTRQMQCKSFSFIVMTYETYIKRYDLKRLSSLQCVCLRLSFCLFHNENIFFPEIFHSENVFFQCKMFSANFSIKIIINWMRFIQCSWLNQLLSTTLTHCMIFFYSCLFHLLPLSLSSQVDYDIHEISIKIP